MNCRCCCCSPDPVPLTLRIQLCQRREPEACPCTSVASICSTFELHSRMPGSSQHYNTEHFTAVRIVTRRFPGNHPRCGARRMPASQLEIILITSCCNLAPHWNVVPAAVASTALVPSASTAQASATGEGSRSLPPFHPYFL